MSERVIRKIHIIGSVGSGKTTLARNLSSQLDIPFYELDNIMWERNPSGDRRRSESERRDILAEIVKSDAWIVEGVHYDDWVHGSFQQAERIIFLDPPYPIRVYRIIKRFILQKAKIEKANYQPSFTIFKKMFKWNAEFENKSKPLIIKDLRTYNEKLIFLNHTKARPF